MKIAYIQKFEVPSIFVPKRFSKKEGKEVGGFMAKKAKTGFDFIGGVVQPKNAIFIEAKTTLHGEIPLNQEKVGIKKHQLETMLWLESIGFECMFLWRIRSADIVFRIRPQQIIAMVGPDAKRLTLVDCQEARIPRVMKVKYQGVMYYDFLGRLD